MRALLFRACLILGLASTLAPAAASQPDAADRLVTAIEAAIRAGDHAALRALARPGLDAGRLAEFAVSLAQTPSPEATVKERDRTPLANGGQRLLLEVLTVTGGEGRVSTWRIDAAPGPSGASWAIADIERITQINGLYRLALDASAEWDVRNAVITAPDVTLTVATGYAFAARVPDGPTAMVFVGRGTLAFTPAPEAERNQVRIFSGREALRTGFGALFIRVAPGDFASRVTEGSLKPRAVDAAHLRRAQQVFETQLPNSFEIDLNDLSAAQWSLVPTQGDFVAEIATGKYGALTYARSGSEPEDISFFDRRRKRSEDDKVDYNITRYRIDASYSPERLWLDGTAALSVHARNALAGTMMLHLADPLVVRSITSPQLGRLLHLRIVGQNNVLIGLPGLIPPDAEFDMVVTYGGRLPPQTVEREAVAVQQDPQGHIPDIVIPAEPQWAYSNRSYWYPQGLVTGYATATIAMTVPGEYDVVASGTPQGPPSLLAAPPGQKPRKRYLFESREPARYLAFAVSRFQASTPVPLKLRDDEEPITVLVTANPRQATRMRQYSDKTTDILRFYASLLGDAPYDSFTLALTEGDLPGGHSPAYLALLAQPLPFSPYVWSADPVSFQGYPSFFLAHEVAHQWWGQAIGVKNYHEQWLSEGFAQYFAAMYAERERGPDTFAGVVKQMRRWAVEMSPQGPVYLGYRLGHIRADSRVFRALVYNKGAMALHMLRRLLGDDVFFAGLRDFYETWRFKKAGTDDFRIAMEKAAGGRPLGRFFDRWIYGSGIPTVRFHWRIAGNEAIVRLEQGDEIYDVPLTITIGYANGETEDFILPLTEKGMERHIPVKREVRSIDVNKDGGALVDVVR